MIRLYEILIRAEDALSRVMASWYGKVGVSVLGFAMISIIGLFNPLRSPDTQAIARNIPLANGWVTNCTGPEFGGSKGDGFAGPGPDRPVFRVTDQLVLAVSNSKWPSSGRIESEPRECSPTIVLQ